jgi:hypothetical protein
MFAPPICRRSRRNASRADLVVRGGRFVGCDEDGGFPGRTSQRAQRAIRHSERKRAEQSNTDHAPAVLRRSERTCFIVCERRRSRRARGRDPRPRCSRRRSAGGADETHREQTWLSVAVVSSDATKTAAFQRTSQRAQRAIRHSERKRAEQSNTDHARASTPEAASISPRKSP